MFHYKVILKNGMFGLFESKWLDIGTVNSMLIDHQPFVQLGDMIFAKNSIAMIEKIEVEKLETTEKEN